ncbi:MAG TPA: radical SAM protein [Terracidiphilus sp.]|nr:radical SAM protein [Terracidiphilus sp.]
MQAGAVLIGFQEQGNLGIGYVAAMLRQNGFAVRILDFRDNAESIAETVQEENPALVGFSLIFQYYVPEFHRLASCLRSHGVSCHFTAGGHYPSLRSEETLRDIPELDSIVRFEGEITALELMQCLADGRDWRQVHGIAYRESGRCILTPPRPLIADLDSLPFPARPLESDLIILGRKASPILASRGCCRDCSFCSIREFYSQVPGRKVRVRNPAFVVEEMKQLHQLNRTDIFLFQDDDFPVWGDFGRRWVEHFIASLQAADLYGRVLWKISCRADEIDSSLFARLRDAGLYMVYLGIESGNETGLEMLNKRLHVRDVVRAVATIQSLGLAFTYGFMLFDPSSTFHSVRDNIHFLRNLTRDGRIPVVFCRMLPYAGTPIETRLKQEGRLRGNVHDPSYDFTNPAVSLLFDRISAPTGELIQGSNSLANQLNFAWQEFWVMKRMSPVEELDKYGKFLRSVTTAYNRHILQWVECATTAHEMGDESRFPSWDPREHAGELSRHLLLGRDDFMLRHQDLLLKPLGLYS